MTFKRRLHGRARITGSLHNKEISTHHQGAYRVPAGNHREHPRPCRPEEGGNIAEGKSVVDGVGQYDITAIAGSFYRENQLYTKPHSVSYTPGQLLRDQLKAVKVICNGLAGGKW